MSQAEYMREWRKTPAGKAALENQKKRDRAKRKAILDLIDAHLVEFEILLQKRLQEQNISD